MKNKNDNSLVELIKKIKQKGQNNLNKYCVARWLGFLKTDGLVVRESQL
jgi:hypothetical protein